MGKITLGAKVLKLLGIGAKAGSKGGKIITKPMKLGALGGLGTFFGFEWLTSGGLVDAVGGGLGVDDTAASLIIVAVVLTVVGVLIYALYKHIAKPTRSPARTTGGRK